MRVKLPVAGAVGRAGIGRPVTAARLAGASRRGIEGRRGLGAYIDAAVEGAATGAGAVPMPVIAGLGAVRERPGEIAAIRRLGNGWRRKYRQGSKKDQAESDDEQRAFPVVQEKLCRLSSDVSRPHASCSPSVWMSACYFGT